MQNESTSVLAVFETVASRGEVSRAELSQITGFSLVTVGKAVEQLITCGVAKENKRSTASVGRKSGVCSLIKEQGMIIFSVSDEKCLVRIFDLALNCVHEFEADSSEPESVYLSAFGAFTEIYGGQLFGVGISAPEGTTKKYAESFKETMGQYPELVIEDSRAYAAANARRLDSEAVAVLVRLFENCTVDGAITYKNRLYSGASGRAGGFGHIVSSKESLASKLFDICHVLDPETVHIGCENEADCDIAEKLSSMLIADGVSEDALPRIISEPLIFCRSASDGAALLLREQQLISKLSKNS